LKKYKKHRFLFIILSKNHTGKDREEIAANEIWTTHDFAERLSLQFQGQSQHEYFGGGRTVSLEGVAVQFQKSAEQKQMDFHTFISNGKQQDAAVVHNHFDKLLKFFKSEGLLQEGSTIFCNTDGCSGQYRCGTAFYFLSSLSYTHKLAISRAVGAPGHGKCIVDGLNGNSKRKLTIAAGRQLKSTDGW